MVTKVQAIGGPTTAFCCIGVGPLKVDDIIAGEDKIFVTAYNIGVPATITVCNNKITEEQSLRAT
jgi:hypothetical protein